MELFFLALLVLIMAGALGSGYPVAFALPGAAIITIGLAAGAGYLFAGSTDAYFHSGGPQQWLSAGVINLRGVYWEVERDTLIAIPLFIFMGIMLQRSKIAEDLLVTMAQLFGPVPGGLGISVVFVGALLAATTGIVGATVVAMGLISLPAMLRNKYSPSLATGTIAASGTLGQIIPPSIVLIILADQLASATDQASSMRKDLYKDATGDVMMPSVLDVASTSAGEMFLGAFVPGIVLVGLYMVYILVFAIIRPSSAPAVPYEGKFDGAFWRKVFLTLVPPLTLIFLVLGSIISGVATVNQAGAIGAAGALVMAGYRLPKAGPTTYYPALLAMGALLLLAFVLANFEMNLKAVDTASDRIGIAIGILGTIMLITALVWSGWRVFKLEDTLQGVMLETAKTTSLVFIILLGAAMLTAAFRAFGGEELVREFLNSLPGGFWSKFIIVMLVIFILGFFLDFIEIAVVVVPIVAPILLADPEANVTAVWLGVMIGLNIQTSFLTPPFGFALFYLRGVAPKAVKTIQMYKGVIAFIGLQLLALVIVAFNPPLVNYLPMRVSLTAETAPPPVNPALQYCIEKYVSEEFDENGDSIRAAIEKAANLDLSYLPESIANDFGRGVSKAGEAMDGMAEIQELQVQLTEAAVDYRPLHRVVRRLQADANRIDVHISELQTRIRRDNGDVAKMEAEVADLKAEKEEILAQIPDTWEETQAVYGKITNADRRSRNLYRRAADQAYEAVSELRAIVAGADALAEFDDDLAEIAAAVPDMTPEQADEQFSALERAIGEVAGARDIRSLLSDARREIDDRSPDHEAAAELVAEAQALLTSEVAWRTRAATELAPALAEYDAAIQTTIGLRKQPRLPKEQALYVASCNAEHRDISLNF
ncbi:MAG: TRAP transporter large permease subunit [Rhodobacteraceae bacterium]|nr:TRAP transporter large permease subunit [Paracoccaceae bacterium]